MGKKFNMAIAYNAKADKASWKELQKFLTKGIARGGFAHAFLLARTAAGGATGS